jgi:predicted Zn-dependent protease
LSPAARVRLTVAAAAVVTAGVVTGVVLATRQSPPELHPFCATRTIQPLIVPGVESAHVAAVRAAMAKPARQAVDALEQLEIQSPNDPVVQFNYGVALLCTGYLPDATQALRAAKRSGRDTFYEMRADEILHPQYFQPSDGIYPVFQPAGAEPLLRSGARLQEEGHQHSAERVYERAARVRPDDPQAQVAAAVGRFDEDDLAASFGRLGPLTARFPHSQSVRFHLGLLLAWVGRRDKAIVQFRLARADGPETALGKEANAFLARLVTGGTKSKRK